MRRVALLLGLLVLLVGTAQAVDRSPAKFPKIRYGIGNESTSGGGWFAGTPYKTRDAVIAWSRRRHSLILYFLRKRVPRCTSLIGIATARPGRLIQAYIGARPVKRLVGRRVPKQTIEFIGYPAGSEAVNDQGLRDGAKLVFTRIDSYPGGIWHGSLFIPTKTYANGLVYGYRGTFAARYCDLKRR